MPNSKDQLSSDSGFTKKSIEQPILDSSLRDRLSQPVVETTIPIEPTAPAGNFFKQNKFYILAIIIGLAVIAVLAALAFRKSPAQPPKAANIGIEIDAPQTLASGTETLYKINVQNKDSQKLTDLQLEVTYPDGFDYVGGIPKANNLSGTVFSAKQLVQGETASFIIKVKTSGAAGDEKKLSAKLHYKFNNFNSEFTATAEFALRLVAPDIVLELNGPQNTNPAQLIVYTLKYQNNSTNDLKNVRVKMDYPEGFEYSSAQPVPDLGSDTWTLSSLAKGGSGTITIQGNFRSTLPGQSKTATAHLLVQDGNGQFAEQSKSDFTTQMGSLPLTVSQQLGSDHPTDTVNPGDTLVFAVDYQNNNNTAVTGVNIIVSLDPKVLDLSTLRAEGAQVSGSTVTWNAASVSQLENLSPSETGHLSYSVMVKNPATKDSTRNLTVTSNIKIKANEYSDFFPGNQLVLKVASPSAIDGQSSYLSGQQPPQVGRDTIYKIKITLTNSSNDYSDGIVTMFIPLGSGGYQNSVNSNESTKVDYDQSTGKLTWNFGNLSAYTGKFTPARVLEFNVKLNPSASQAYSSPVLVKDIKMTAKDTFTGQEININSDNITTSDAAGNVYGGGSVQP